MTLHAAAAAKLELLSNATTIDSALNYIRSKQQEQHKRERVVGFN
jgi:hypothetical protein